MHSLYELIWRGFVRYMMFMFLAVNLSYFAVQDTEKLFVIVTSKQFSSFFGIKEVSFCVACNAFMNIGYNHLEYKKMIIVLVIIFEVLYCKGGVYTASNSKIYLTTAL